jgi:hypothetical protein
MGGRNRRRSAAKKSAYAGADASQTVGLAGDHKTRGFPSHADGLGSVSSCALSQPISIVTSVGGRAIPDRGGRQANIPATSAWSKPLRIMEVSQPSKKDVVTKMPIRQPTQQHLQRADSPVAQVKPTPVEKEAEKKKRKPYYKEVKTDIRGPAYWKAKMAADARLFAQGIWRAAVGRKEAGSC